MKESYPQILETRITHPDRPEYSSYEQGVAILIFNTKGEILLGKEAYEDARYGRKRGQFNILTETREPGERIKETVKKGLKQELGVEYRLFRMIDGSYRETTNCLTRWVGRSLCLLYTGNPSVSASLVFHSQDDEIVYHEWVPLGRISEYDMEEEAKMTIDYYVTQALIREYIQ